MIFKKIISSFRSLFLYLILKLISLIQSLFHMIYLIFSNNIQAFILTFFPLKNTSSETLLFVQIIILSVNYIFFSSDIIWNPFFFTNFLSRKDFSVSVLISPLFSPSFFLWSFYMKKKVRISSFDLFLMPEAHYFLIYLSDLRLHFPCFCRIFWYTLVYHT